MGRFLQSGWPSILVSTSLKTEFLELQQELERKLETKDGKKKIRKGEVGRGAAVVEGKTLQFKEPVGSKPRDKGPVRSVTHTSLCSVLCW